MSRHFHDANGRYVYRGIELWMQRTQTSLVQLAERTGISAGTLGQLLKGRTESPRKDTIDRILAATGLTYEEAFRREKRRKNGRLV